MTAKRNGKIEILRFFFCMSVLLFHLNTDVFGNWTLATPAFSLFAHGRTGVEFFFLVSGFLCAKSASRMKDSHTPIGTDTFNFILRKVKSIFPYHIIVVILIVIVLWSCYPEIFLNSVAYKLPSVFFLQRTGLSKSDINSIEWYIAAMLLALTIVYPLLRKWYDFTLNVIAPVGSVMLIGYLIKVYDSMPSVSDFVGFTYLCNLRALGVILLGVFAFNVSERIRAAKLSKAAYRWLVFAEGFCWIFSMYFIISAMESFFEAYATFAMAGGVAITFSRDLKGKFYNSKFVMYLGKITLPVYLCQNIIRWLSDALLVGHVSLVARFLIQAFATLLLGIGIYELWNAIKRSRAKKKKVLTNS